LPDMWQFRVDMKVPLYFWRKQRLGVTESELKLSQAKHDTEAVKQSLNAELGSQYSQAKTARELLQLYSQRIANEAAATLESSLVSYQAGKVDFLTVLNNLVTVRQYKLRYQEELTKYQKALARLEELTALSLIQ
jgi:outer membrane protein, heavy metal efflux system